MSPVKIKHDMNSVRKQSVDILSDGLLVVFTSILWLDSIYSEPAVFIHRYSDHIDVPCLHCNYRCIIVWSIKYPVALYACKLSARVGEPLQRDRLISRIINQSVAMDVN
jgi:hypothetical protein